ncbi:apolipoprotein N-acyltransferase [Sphingomonas sp. ASV193]|uniref:apolipoprotein N-acyltransferase n=1 Tax=Sphingomonas sp. ASV193 TaxID=3144405 RepID=UPI0032E8F341
MIFLAALIFGAISAFAFQPFGMWPLMPPAFALLADLVWRAPRMRSALLVGWLFGLGQFCVGLNWIATAFTFQAKMPPWLGWLAVVLLSLYLAVYPMLATGLAKRFGGSRLSLVLALGGGWALTEWLRATMFTGFSWNPVGVALVDIPLRDTTRLIGTYGLSGLLVLIGGAAWLLAKREWKPGAGIVAGAIVLLVAADLAVPVLLDRPSLPIRIVQPNIGQDQRWSPDAAKAHLDALVDMSVGGRTTPRLLFWPESAVTYPLDDQRPAAKWNVVGDRLAATSGLGADQLLLAGSEALNSSDGVNVTGAANRVFVLGPLGNVLGRYDKAHLVPYGEYLPMRPLLSTLGISRLAPGDLDFAAGPGPQTLTLPGGTKVGLQICYEMIFSGEVVDRANRPDFLFNPSNDAWFGRWGPPQHLAQARLRAVEEGLPVIRATPTGISALVDADGALLSSLPWKTAGVIDATLPAPRGPTLFATLGNLVPILAAMALLLAAIALHGRRRYSAT